MAVTSRVELGREAFDRRSWREAYELLDAAAPLGADDLERLAVAAHLVGEDDASARAWERAHLAFLDAGDRERAARCAFWLGLALVLRGEMATSAAGWRERNDSPTRSGRACAACGYPARPGLHRRTGGGRRRRGERGSSAEIVDIARRCADTDLLSFGMVCVGQALIAHGDVAGGLRHLDEAMVAVSTGEVTPIPAGIIYCAVIEMCVFAFDIRRAAEWTGALHAWCTSEPDLVPYRGQCLVHRSQVLLAHGDWIGATAEALLAAERLTEPPHPALGTARYQQGELHRLRGEFAEADAAYREAGTLGRDPSPGIALLRLAQARLDDAAIAIRRMLAEGGDPRVRPAVLAAAVEIFLAADDVVEARLAHDELATIADAAAVPALRTMADGALGALLSPAEMLAPPSPRCAERSPGGRHSGCPTRPPALASPSPTRRRALGDDDSAELERQAARATFERLGAAPDLQRLAGLDGAATAPTGDLTDREVEVLRLVATGRTNREIAETLVISTHTVARHLQNIFLKLGLSSRAAATAYAYEHHLIG